MIRYAGGAGGNGAAIVICRTCGMYRYGTGWPRCGCGGSQTALDRQSVFYSELPPPACLDCGSDQCRCRCDDATGPWTMTMPRVVMAEHRRRRRDWRIPPSQRWKAWAVLIAAGVVLALIL